MSDQSIENIVDEIIDIVLTRLYVREIDTSDGSGKRYYDYEFEVDDRQREKLVGVFEKLFA